MPRESQSAAQARLEAALPTALARIAATPEVYAALWCGSAARRQANEFSDLDFHVLVRGNERWRTNFMVDGVPVEVFHNPPAKVRAMFAAQESDTVTMYAEGQIVLPHPELTALQDEARVIYAAGRTPQAVPEFTRFMLIDNVWDARAALNEAIHAKVVLSALGPLLMRPLYAQCGWWDVKPQHWLSDLQNRDAQLAQHLSTVLTTADPHERQRAFEELAQRVAGELAYRDGHTERLVVAET